MNHLGVIWVHFNQPAWLPAGILSLVPLVLAIRNRRRGVQTNRLRVFLQFLALFLAALSLAGPVVPFSLRPPRWFVLRDVSASVGEQNAALSGLSGEVAFERYAFAGRLLGREERDDLDATNLRPALDWSTAAIRAERADGVILLTDGRFQDDWQNAAREYAQTRAGFWIVPLDAPPTDARIESIAVRRRPSRASPRSVTTYDISVRLSANAPMRRRITLFRLPPGRAKRKVSPGEIVLEPDRPVTIHFRDTIPADLAGIWQAELTPHDSLPQNDTYQAASVPTKTRLAWVTGRFAQTLQDVDVVSFLPADAPVDPTGWLGYSAVILADATGTLLSRRQRSALAGYVRGGGGLVLLGAGPHEKPADKDDPLNRILPLRADPFERNPLNLSVVLDASGSMVELTGSPAQPKWSLASEALLSLREDLTSADRLRVIVFSDTARLIYDSGSAGPDFPTLADALRKVRPNGPTNIAPALECSLGLRSRGGLDVPSKRSLNIPSMHHDQKSMQQEQGQDVPAMLEQDAQATRSNLVLVLSDLQTAKFDPVVMAREFRKQCRSLTVVATGSAGVEKTSLAQLAQQLRTPLIYREHLRGLADVFARLCHRARGGTIRRGEFTVRYDSDWPVGARVSRIHAYIPAAVAGKALIEARIEQTNDPLLVVGLAGLGKVAVVSVPPEAILHQSGGERLLAEWIRRVARLGDDPRFDVQTTRTGDGLHIRVTVRDKERAVNNLSLRAEVLRLSGPSAAPIQAELSPSAPGVYEATVGDAAGSGRALAVRVLEKPGRLCWQGVAPAHSPTEFARVGADYEQLRKLAAITGGKIIEPAALCSPAMREELRRPRRLGGEIWPIPLTGAILAMLLAWMGGSGTGAPGGQGGSLRRNPRILVNRR